MIVWIRAHIGQFCLYLISGGLAMLIDFGSFVILIRYLGVWYILASLCGSVLGFFTVFLMHKYIVFKKRERFLRHLAKFFLTDMTNIAITTALLYVFVEFGGIGEEVSKLIIMGMVVSWNFFVYKFLVYI